MSTSDTTYARQVLVTASDGVRVPGWIVRRDVVVIQAGGLKQPLRVRDGKVHAEAGTVHESEAESCDAAPWTALELPTGTFDIEGEHYPPTLPENTGGVSKDGQRFQARVAFWCLVFPRMRGCR